MKARITILMAMILGGSQAVFGQWTNMAPGLGGTFDFIECADQSCYMSGDQGEIMKTTDGNTWVNIGSSTIDNTAYLTGLNVFDRDTVYVFGNNGVFAMYRTYDGGQNWSATLIGDAVSYMHFINTSVGYAIRTTSLLKTTDKGDTWNVVNNSMSGAPLFFVNEDVGFICKNTAGTTDKIQIWKTINGGQNFTMVYEGDGGSNPVLTDLQMVTDQVGYACGGNGKILKTTNGGDSWTELAHPASQTASFRGLDFINPTNGYVISVGGTSAILKTTDGGQSWTNEHFVGGSYVNVAIKSLDTAFITSGATNLIYRNTNAGLTAKIFENEQEIGQLYPNPANDILNVNIQRSNTSITIYDLVGNKVLEQDLSASQLNSIPISEFKTGVYIYEIKGDQSLLNTGKLIKN